MNHLTAMRRPGLCFVGPNLGRHADWVPSQAEILASLFADKGHPVLCTSSIRQPALRLADMVGSLVRWRGQIDVVILAVFSGWGFVAADIASRAARLLGLPQIQHLHGGRLPDFTSGRPRALRRLLARADAIVAPSGYLAELARERGFPAHVVPNVLDLEKYPFRLRREATPRLLWMRTFHRIYNPRLAIETLVLLREAGLRATLTMAGQDKGLGGETRRLAAVRGLDAAVRFPGFLDSAEKQRVFADHDIFLNTNHIDNMPVTVLEAAAFGLPIVATRVGGIPHLLKDGHSGLLVADDDAREMAAAVRRLHDEPEVVHRLSRGGRSLAESCSWPRVYERWTRLFDDLFERRHSAGHGQFDP
ncbi:MAG: glycosyltransferase family 4 protein [bacterium]|nr:glycosyltransferase family 4 protein [bacterium]